MIRIFTERVGFEPTNSVSIKRFRVVRFRPLSHLSPFIDYAKNYIKILSILTILIFNSSLHLSSILSQENYLRQVHP